ncbi:hypothetical protein ACRRTK_019414 [Alexandromys fortis]
MDESKGTCLYICHKKVAVQLFHKVTFVQWAWAFLSPVLWVPSQIGSYNYLPGQVSCFPCPAGYYCPENITSYNGYPCPAGFYCPRGTKHATQFPCPRGYYNPDPLTQSLDSCLPCPPGHYCGQENLTKPSGACDAGWYCVSAAWTARPFDLDNYTSTNCLCPATATGGKCPAGSYCPEGSPEPTPCPPGFFCATSGLSTPTGSCQAGYFCTGGSKSPAPEDEVTGGPCPPGSFCRYYCDSSMGPVQDFSLYPCPRGYYCPVGTAKAMHHSCPVGTYSPQKGLTSITECQLCPAGKFCSLAGITAPTGFYCSEGTGVDWQPCPPGTYGFESGLNSLAECQACDGGKFCPRANATEAGGQCWEGFYCTRGSTRPNPEAGTEVAKPKSWFQSMLALVLLDTIALEVQPCLSPAHLAPLDLGLSLAQRPLALHVYLAITVPLLALLTLPGPAVKASSVSGEPLSPTTCWKMGPVAHALQDTFAHQALSRQSHAQLVPTMPWLLRATVNPAPRGTGKRFPDGPCLAGYYCPPGQTSATPMSFRCPRGFYCPEGSPQPKACGNGTFQPQETQGSCELCPMGFYCEASSSGMFCGSQGLTQPSGLCHSGHYCTGGAVSPTPIQHKVEGPGLSGNDICPPGFFCPMGTGFPLPCPPGFYSSAGGLNSKDQCQPCPSGHYCSEPGLAQVPEASLCHAGPLLPTGFSVPSALPRGDNKEPRGVTSASQELHGLSCATVGTTSPPWAQTPAFHVHQAPIAHILALGYPGPVQHMLTAKLELGPRVCVPQGPSLLRMRQVFRKRVTALSVLLVITAGFYCPEGSGEPIPCPPHTLVANPGAQRKEDCGPCPPGQWCKAEPGASSPQDCELCPSGYYCPDTQVTGRANVFAIPCQPGSECPAGAVEMVPCRAGSYCGPRTGVPPLCPGGFACPAGSSTYTGPGQRCVFPYYCPQGSTHPLGCPGGSEALNKSGLRVSVETSCRLCAAGTYRSPTLDTLTCQPCPPGFICPQGGYHLGKDRGHPSPGPVQQEPLEGTAKQQQLENASRAPQAPSVPCQDRQHVSPVGVLPSLPRGLNRIFQKSDGSCICQAGYVFYDHMGLESDQESDSHGDGDCQPQVAQHCPPGDVRLAATRECVSPQQYDCTSFCGPAGGKLSTALGICQCLGYVSAEELCDIRCLANAPQLSLSWDPGKELTLSVKSNNGDSIQKVSIQEVSLLRGSVQGVNLLRGSIQEELLETLGPDMQFPGSARVYLVQFGPHGTFGFIISRVDMLISLLQGTAVPSLWVQRHRRTTGRKRFSIDSQIPNPVICLAAGDVILFQLHLLPHNRSASHYPMYQRQHLLNTNSHWDSGAFRRLGHLVRETNLSLSRFAHQFLDPGTYVFQDNGKPENIAVVSVKEEGAACGAGLSPVQPSSPYQLGRLGVLRHGMLTLGPDWAVITGVLLATGLATALLTGLGLLLKPAVPQAYLTKSWGFQWRSLGQPPTPAARVSVRDNAHWGGKKLAFFAGEAPQALTLEDFSVRTLYDKLEDQSLHVAAQLSRHRKDALAFYGAASKQLQGLQVSSAPSWATTQKATTALLTLSPQDFHYEEASSQHDEQSCVMSSEDSPVMGQPPFHDQEPQSRPQQVPELLQILQEDIEERDAQTLSPEKWILGAGLRHRPDVELQKKIWQVEEALDELNEEFFRLSAQALELQKGGDKLDRIPPGEDNTSVSTQALMLEVQRIHLAQRIEDLEWELSLLLQISSSSSGAEGSRPSHSASQHVPEPPWMLRWPPVGRTFYIEDTTTSPC